MPPATDLLDLNVADVLRLLHLADQSLRAHDISYVHDRLAVTDILGHFNGPDLSAHYLNTVTRPAACIAAFVAGCQQRGLWDWCQSVMSFAGMNAITIANAAAARVSPECVGRCDSVPVATICFYPGAYRLVALADLPYGHSPGRCGYKGTDEYCETETRLKQASRQSLVDRMRGNTREVLSQDVWGDIQHRVESRELNPCELHIQSLDWRRINDAALCIREQTPCSISNGVEKWDYKTASHSIYRSVNSYSWDGIASDRLPQTREALRSLFNDPITWQPGYEQVANGQHRICALRRVKATHAFIVDAKRHDDLHRRWRAGTRTP